MRRIARVLNINPKTVARKLTYLGQTLHKKMATQNLTHVSHIQFDELQTIEHTKLKPLSVAMAVSAKDRHRIIGFPGGIHAHHRPFGVVVTQENGIVPTTGSVNLLPVARTFNLDCQRATPLNRTNVRATSHLSHVFPRAKYQQFKGKKGSIAGQGELKKVVRDPPLRFERKWGNHNLCHVAGQYQSFDS